jgi:hypothetical protein
MVTVDRRLLIDILENYWKNGIRATSNEYFSRCDDLLRFAHAKYKNVLSELLHLVELI